MINWHIAAIVIAAIVEITVITVVVLRSMK